MPISNLSVVSKLPEHIVFRQLYSYLSAADLLPRLQSAYRTHHSTETAVLKVLTNILYAVDDGDLSVLALLDLSTAFDTIDHDILLTRLKVSFGICGAALDWLQSYLTSRLECVQRGAARSTHKTVRFDVPQGSVLGPLLFILYTAGLIDLIDDTQIQGSCRFGSANQLQSTLSACLDEVSDWMLSNRLQLNTAKSEILWCSTTRRQNHLPSAAVRVRENYALPSTTVCDLGVLIDSNVAMQLMCRVRCPDVLLCYDSSTASDAQCLILSFIRWSCHWLCHVSTTATQHSQDFLRLSSVDFCRFSMPPPD